MPRSKRKVRRPGGFSRIKLPAHPPPSQPAGDAGGLKLNRIGRIAQMPDTPATRGMLAKVSHLVRVIEAT